VRREEALDRLAGGRFDLAVVGGGIVGAGVAALAAEHGLSVALVDRGDFASGTSSASSKLIHGGLRYLRMGDFRLVREALQESQTLATRVAPHLVRPLRFVLPVFDEGPYGRSAIRAGLWLYRALAGSPGEAFRLVDAPEARRLVPALRAERLTAAGAYSDAQTNDARLCLAVLRSAEARGAVVVNYAELVGLAGAFELDVADRIEGSPVRVAARAVVNAAGPWVDRVRRLEDPGAGRSVALSKGVHLVLRPREPWSTALTIPQDGTRVSFVLPWEGMLLLGTTDERYEADPDEVGVDAAEEAQVLAEAARALVPGAVGAEDVVARFAGLRVLPLGPAGTARARREVTILRGPKGMLSVAGGKLTTYRRIARAVLAELGVRDRQPPSPLPDVAPEVLAYADALEPLVPGEPELVAHVLHARDREWAVRAEDVLRRRTTLALRGFDEPELRRRVDELLSARSPAPDPAGR